MDWTPWHPLEPELKLSPPVLAELLDGGQAFRWRPLPSEPGWQGLFGATLARLRIQPRRVVPSSPEDAVGTVEYALPCCLDGEVATARLHHYLGFGRDWSAVRDALPWRSDPVLRAAMDAWPGLRILAQEPGEALLAFLCSSNKRIAQIRQMCDFLAEALGHPAVPGYPARTLPGWRELARASESELRACRLGYRARYIAATAERLAASPGWFERVAQLPYPEAREALLALPGVGAKVADCVLLFGFARLEAFPVDVWVLRSLTERYALGGWSPAQMGHFGRIHFGPSAGLAQQYLFAGKRRRTGKATAEPPS